MAKAASLQAEAIAEGPQAEAVPAYRRLHLLGREVAAGLGSVEQQQARLVAIAAELIDAHALGFVTERDGVLTLRDFALDARHRADHLSIGNELRLAASECLRTREPRMEPSANIQGAFLLATTLADSRSAVAAIKSGGEAVLPAARATLELAALAMSFGVTSRGGGAIISALAALAAADDAVPREPAELAARLLSALGARMIFIAAANGELMASAPGALPNKETPAHRELRALAKRAAGQDRPVVVRSSDGDEKQVAIELNATKLAAFRIGDKRDGRDVFVIAVEPARPFSELDAGGWAVARSLIEARTALPPARARRNWRPKRSALATLFFALAAGVALLVPIPDRIRAEATLEADGRHFVSASFSGVLREARVKAGDVVGKDDTIALLEGEALQLARNTAASKADEAFRRRDAAIREKRITDAELARNEGEAAAAERDLLDWQLANLELKAPVDGVVLDSPLEQSAGAPVREGDVVAEIAPLEHIRVRVDVPVETLSRLPPDAEASLYLDGVQSAAIAIGNFRIAPEVETINGSTVLPVWAVIENSAHALRPGQRGVAIIPTGRALIGKVLFRDAWIALTRWWR